MFWIGLIVGIFIGVLVAMGIWLYLGSKIMKSNDPELEEACIKIYKRILSNEEHENVIELTEVQKHFKETYKD